MTMTQKNSVWTGTHKPRKPRELNKLIDLLKVCGIRTIVQRTNNGVPYVELNGYRVCWFNNSKEFRLFGPVSPNQRRYGAVKDGTSAAAFLLLGPKTERPR